jgi:tetratricopeptide (TPR) repeat protein
MTLLFCRRFKLFAPLSALTFLLAGSSFASDKPFTEVRSPNFRVLTTGSEHDARRIALEFEQMRAVFAVGFPKMRLTTGAPLLIFAMQTEFDMKMLAPAMWKNHKGPLPAGLFDHGWEKQFAVVRLDQDVPGAYNVVYHEYVHTLLHSNFRWLPTWLDEGLAEFYGNTRFEGKNTYVGAPSIRVEQLKNRSIIPLETLLVVNPWSYYHGDENQISAFYSESWALVHYLVFGADMEGGKKLNRFYNQLQAGDPQLKAFREVFGDPKNVEDGLRKYIQAFTFRAYTLENLTAIQAKDFSSRKLSRAESDAEIAGYRLWEHDAPEATDLVERALQDDPALGTAHEEKAFIHFREGKDEDALREFSRACELDKTLYLSQYFKAMMTAKRETPEQREALRAELEQIKQINPQFAPAYVQLAMLFIADGQGTKALVQSRKAEQLEPSRAGYHLLSGEMLLRMKREKDAAETARYVAERWHGPDHNEAVALWNRVPAASRPADATVVEEVEEQSQTAEGKIHSLSCGEKGKNEVTLQRGDDLMVFKSKGRQMIGYSDTLWYGSDHFTLCHHVEGMHAVIRYRPAVSKEFAGDWLSIELRDELPPEPQQQAEKSPQTQPPAAAPVKQD